MCRRSTFSRMILPLGLPAPTAAILSCAPPETVPRAWIDWPLDLHEVEAGGTLSLICHAYAREGGS